MQSFEQDAFVPSDEAVKSLNDIVKEHDQDLYDIKMMEERLKLTKQRVQERARSVLPEKMAELGIHEIELRDGRMLILSDIVYGRATPEGMEWLKKNGHEDLISLALAATAARGDASAAKLMHKLLTMMIKAGVKAGIKETVHWKTMEAFLREQVVERQVEVPLELFNGYVGPFAKIKETK
jgi:hypothetical protein